MDPFMMFLEWRACDAENAVFCQLHWVMKDTVALGSELWLIGSRVGACVGLMAAETRHIHDLFLSGQF